MSAAEGETQIPAGLAHLSQEGVLKFQGEESWNNIKSDFDAAELERLVGDYGPLIKEVDLT